MKCLSPRGGKSKGGSLVKTGKLKGGSIKIHHKSKDPHPNLPPGGKGFLNKSDIRYYEKEEISRRNRNIIMKCLSPLGGKLKGGSISPGYKILKIIK